MSRRRRTSLRLRLTVLVGVVVGAGIVMTVLVSYRLTESQVLGQVDSFVRERAHAVAGAPDQLPSGQFPGSDNGHGPGNGGGNRPEGGGNQLVGLDAVTQVVAPDGSVTRTLGGPALPVDAATKSLAANGGADHVYDATVDGTRYRIASVANGQSGSGAVQVARPLTGTDSVLSSLRRRLALIAVAGVAIAAALAWLLARRTTRPLRALTDASREVAKTQQLDASVPSGGDAEVADLAESLNAMLAALGTSRAQQRQLVQDAGHELRTPLTSVRANLEYLRRAPAGDPERDTVLDDALGEVDELSALTEELVALATDQATDEPAEDVDLGDLVEAVAQRTAKRLGAEVDVVVEAPDLVTVRRNTFEHAIANIVGNAAKFAGRAGTIEVAVHGSVVTVRDHGPGFEPDDLPHVFDRFYRAASARSLPGSGLGLAIVRQTVESSGGRVEATNAPGGGALVTMSLPPARAHS
jgi:two-component system sensor histidine kinase MprB